MLLQTNTDTSVDAQTVGKALLKSKGFFTTDGGYWISIGALVAFAIVFNILYILALTYLSRKYHYLFLAETIVCWLEERHTYTHIICSVPASGSSNTLVPDEENESEANASSNRASSIPMGEVFFKYPC
jgi:hypothetical protein